MFESYGLLKYIDTKLIVTVDPEIARYYRSFLPKNIKLNIPFYEPHITVIRREPVPNTQLWGKYENELIPFQYDNVIQCGKIYYWLDVYSDRLKEIRIELGLPETSELSRPPTNKNCFHTTIGNLKNL